MRLFKSILVGMTAFLVAGSAAATVTVGNTSAANGTTINVGDTFTVQVRLAWDGASSTLQGIFTSTGYDTSVLQFVSSTAGPTAILGGTDADGDPPPTLTRLIAPASVNGALRTVQYAVGSADFVVDPSGAVPAGRNMAVLTFKAIGGGSSAITAIIAAGDGISGDTFQAGPALTVNVNAIPEPGTALLMGLGFAGLGVAGRRK